MVQMSSAVAPVTKLRRSNNGIVSISLHRLTVRAPLPKCLDEVFQHGSDPSLAILALFT
jgi:hypothetical protein